MIEDRLQCYIWHHLSFFRYISSLRLRFSFLDYGQSVKAPKFINEILIVKQLSVFENNATLKQLKDLDRK